VTPNVRGQFVTDPTCIYDAATQRFFLVVLTLEVVPTTGVFTTVNHLDLAVSATNRLVPDLSVQTTQRKGRHSDVSSNRELHCNGF
jgi:hypothetical protein